MDVCLVKINGWPDTFNERVEIIAGNVGNVMLVRPAPKQQGSSIELDNVTTYDLFPRRGESIDTLWLHLLIFPVYVVEAMIVCGYLSVRSDSSPDVFHALDYVLGGLVVTAVSAVTGVPSIVSVRGLTGPRYEHMAEEGGGIVARLNYTIVTMIPDLVLPRVDAVITKASYQETYLRDEYGLDVRIYTIPTGVDFEAFDPAVVECGTILDRILPDRTRPNHLILHLGRLTADKGLDRLVNLISETDSELPEGLTVLCVGRFRNKEFETQIQSRSRELGDRLIIHSTPIPYDRVPELLGCVDGVVLVSEPAHEGTPRVLQEAYAMERSLIAADVAGISEAFRDLPGCFLIEREDAPAFRDAVNKITSTSVTTNREEARERFDIYRNYSRYAEIYETTVKGPS